MRCPELEGLAIIRIDENRNYLVSSVQGNDSFAIFKISGTFEWMGSFRLAADTGTGIDKVTHTDGIETYSGALGTDYPDGIFIAQDDENTPPGLNQNFKFIRLGEIISGFGL